LTVEQNECRQAREFCEQAVTVARQLAPLTLSHALCDLGRALLQQNEDALARSCLEEGLSFAREMDDRWLIAALLAGLGTALARQGDLASARRRLEEALPLAREEGEPTVLFQTLCDLGRVLGAQGDSGKARCLLEEGLALCRDRRDERGIAACRQALAEIAAREGGRGDGVTQAGARG
jgi:tetratricopeptide (TPR) repeat protein